MTAHAPPSGLQFLSVAQAAERLGVSRVKIREAAARGLIPSQRDNENRLRLDLSGLEGAAPEGGEDLSPAALMHVLFDEVEALDDDLRATAGERDALRDIADRQAEALERAADRLEREAADKARLQELLDRAMAHLERAEGGPADARLAGVADRALGALEETGDRLEMSLAQTARFEALAARALDAAAAGRAAGAEDTRALEQAAERALDMLDTALAGAESSRRAVVRTGEMLERALQSGARLEQQIALRDREIESKSATVERVLEMSEKAVALAASQTPAPPKRGFWQWLTGR